MIYTDLTKRALKICYDAHKDQYDKSGIPYVFHPFHLAEHMDDEYSTVVALLHDTVEDTNITFEYLKEQKFPDQVIEALKLLTHDNAVSYLEYIKIIKSNPIARKVKLADLEHNSDLSRLNVIDEKATNRIAKYKKAIAILME